MAKQQEKKTFGDRLDNFIGVFAPGVAARRQYARFIVKHMLGGYRGAEYGRIHGSWIPGGGSADQDLIPALAKLRERSRDLVRNDGIAAGAVETIVANVVGSGIRPQSRIDKEQLKIDEDYADRLRRKIDKVWENWAATADAGDRMNFAQIEELSERSRLVNGESIIIPVRVNNNHRGRRYSLALQVVEADRLDTPWGMNGDKTIRAGVKVGEFGEPISYYIRKTHPGDYNYAPWKSGGPDSFINYPAFNADGMPNIFHLYHVKRPGQTRGEPFLAPVMNVFKDRADYMEAELVAARVAACFAVFIKKQYPGAESLALTTETDADGRRLQELGPGIVEYLKTGESIEGFSPNRPGGTFGIFMERILRDASAGLGLAYEIVAKDFSRSNYSNTRAALLEARRFFAMQQEYVAMTLGVPTLGWVIEEAYLMGDLPVLDFYTNRAAYVRTRWITPGWSWVDPQKEVTASKDAVANNLSTLADECATQGLDVDDVLEQRAREEKKIKELEAKYGVQLKPSSSAPTAAPAAQPAGTPSGSPEDGNENDNPTPDNGGTPD